MNLCKFNMKRRAAEDSKVTDVQSSTSSKLKNMSSAIEEERVVYDENTNNGFIFNDEHYIPEELLLTLLSSYVDYKSLCSCQLVCKKWNLLMKNYVWRKKAELMLNHTLPLDENIPWTSYYLICHKKPFYRNLIKNHSGQKSLSLNHDSKKASFYERLIKRNSRRPGDLRTDCDWTVKSNGGNGWAVESPPCGVPELPDEPVFDGTNCCFVTSYGDCWKEQVIDLVKEGISEYILDNWQPTVKVSEWFSSRWDCGATYTCKTDLLAMVKESYAVLSHKNYSKTMRDEEQNQWFKFEHEFKNYGRGLRKIKFSHGGKDVKFWAGHYGSKMAGACVTLEIPDSMPPEETGPPEPYYPPDDPIFPRRNNWYGTVEEDDYSDE